MNITEVNCDEAAGVTIGIFFWGSKPVDRGMMAWPNAGALCQR